MFIKKFILRAAGVSVAAIALLTDQPLRAQAPSEEARIEKLEAAVEMLQKENAQLKAEVSSLKKHPAPTSVAGERPTKSEITDDG